MAWLENAENRLQCAATYQPGKRRNFNLPPWPAAVGRHSMGSAAAGGKPSAEQPPMQQQQQIPPDEDKKK
jgi:hypothetical protein